MKTFVVRGYHDVRVPFEVRVETEADDDEIDERVGAAVAELPNVRGEPAGDVVGERITSVVEVKCDA